LRPFNLDQGERRFGPNARLYAEVMKSHGHSSRFAMGERASSMIERRRCRLRFRRLAMTHHYSFGAKKLRHPTGDGDDHSRIITRTQSPNLYHSGGVSKRLRMLARRIDVALAIQHVAVAASRTRRRRDSHGAGYVHAPEVPAAIRSRP
jgi:hypothetical protein